MTDIAEGSGASKSNFVKIGDVIATVDGIDVLGKQVLFYFEVLLWCCGFFLIGTLQGFGGSTFDYRSRGDACDIGCSARKCESRKVIP